MSKRIYKFFWDCGRMGELDGLFIADTSEIQNLIGKEIHFGEVLGKHSDIYGTLNSEDIEVVSHDQDFISKVEEIIAVGTISGFNPLDYYDEEDYEERYDV